MERGERLECLGEQPILGGLRDPAGAAGQQDGQRGPDWQTNPATQIRWGLGYIQSVYGSPCAAWSHEQADGWY
jgi:hypothetical protein